MIDLLAALLGASLRAWRVPGEVFRAADGAIVMTARGSEIRVARAEAGVPFRWTVRHAGRSRHAGSVAGVLRAVRAIVDPDHRPVRLRVSVIPPA